MRITFNTFVLTTIILLFGSTAIYAQYQNLGTANKVEIKENPWFVGGMIGGSLSNNGGSFEISPLVGYKITDDFHVGSRLTYIYSKYDGKSYNDYGGSLFARHRFLEFLFAHVEYEVLNVDISFVSDPNRESRIINSLFVGGGLFQQMGGRGFATIAILYNLLETEYSPYSNPVMRIGFGVGF